MKALLKSLTYLIIFSIVIGAGICLYLLQAPPVEQKGSPKLQIHNRTALRKRPTVDSMPIVYTKDVYRFSLDSQYISNLNSRKLARELVFNASLGHRATLKAQRLDTALKTATDWQKMFTDLTEDIRFRPSASPIEVLLSGEEWRLRMPPVLPTQSSEPTTRLAFIYPTSKRLSMPTKSRFPQIWKYRPKRETDTGSSRTTNINKLTAFGVPKGNSTSISNQNLKFLPSYSRRIQFMRHRLQQANYLQNSSRNS